MTPPLSDADLAQIEVTLGMARVKFPRPFMDLWGNAYVRDVHSLIEAVRTLTAREAALREALQDVLDTEGGAYEHFDGHCTRETECCAGHVARVMAPYRAALSEPREER